MLWLIGWAIVLPRAASAQSPWVSRYLTDRGTALTRPAPGDAVELARHYLRGKAGALGVSLEDVQGLRLSSHHTSEHNQVTHVYFVQTAAGLEVVRGRASVNLLLGGAVLSAGSHLAPDAEKRLNTLEPAIDFREALVKAAKESGIDVKAADAEVVAERGGPSRRLDVRLPALSRAAIPVELKVVPVLDGVRLAWSLDIDLPDDSDSFEALIDAVTGEELLRQSHRAHATPRYRVFPMQTLAPPHLEPVESPLHGAQADRGDDSDERASPEGWLDLSGAGGGEVLTIGNNVDAQEFINGVSYRPNGGASCEFLFEQLDLGTLNQIKPQSQLASFRDAAITNLFHTTNVLHDIFYAYGFNEAAGNFQADNFGRGGLGGDRLRAFRLNKDCSGEFTFKPEGTEPLLLMGSTSAYGLKRFSVSAPQGAGDAVAIAAAQLDGTGNIDLVIANESTANVTVFLNYDKPDPPGQEGFSSIATYSLGGGSYGPRAVVLADLDGQNGPDIAVANAGSNDVTVFSNYGGGTFYYPQTFSLSSYGAVTPRAIVAADLDGDGDLDLAVANFTSQNIILLENYGYGYFYFRSTLWLPGKATGLIALELGGGGLVDLAASTRENDRLAAFFNYGSWYLSLAANVTLPAGSEPASLTGADFDFDGDNDLAVACRGLHRVSVFENRYPSSPYFVERKRVATGTSPVAVSAREVTAAGSQPLYLNDPVDPKYAELVTVNSGSDSVSVRINRHYHRPWYFGRYVFVNQSLCETLKMRFDHHLDAGAPEALVITDLNGDGHPDLVIASRSSPSRILVVWNPGNNPSFSDTSTTSFWRDNALDNGYIAHEFSHGVTWRLTGGPVTRDLGQLHGQNMSEGWSDLFALVMTQTSGPERPRGFSPFFIGEPEGGLGLRTLPPYSPDHLANDITFADFPGNVIGTSLHARGQIWASALWDLYWALASRYGRSNDLYLGAFHPAAGGENVLLQLVIDGCKLQSAEPSFLEARDAILLADVASFGGRNQDIIWQEFASRGMGWGACDNASNCGVYDPTSTSVLADYGMPPLGSVTGTVLHDIDCDGLDAGDPPLQGWKVFLDTNRNGILDPGEQVSITGPTGAYTLVNLYPDVDYEVALEVQSGWRQASPELQLDPESVLNWRRSPAQAEKAANVWGEGQFAFLGHSQNLGVDIIHLGLLEADPSDPAGALAARWLSPDGNSEIQDVEVKGGIAFFASNNNGGASIVDVSDPFAPVRLAQIKAAADPNDPLVIGGGFDKVHNLSVDGSFLYLANDVTPPADQSAVVPVFDVSNPAQPMKVRDIVIDAGSNKKVHDITALGGRLYVCEAQSPGYIHVYDVSQVETGVCRLASFTSGSLTHSAWPTAGGDFLVVCRETQASAANQVEIWDLRPLSGLDCFAPGYNPAAVTIPCASVIRMGQAMSEPEACQSANFVDIPTPGDALSPHNPMVLGDLLYISWYEAGVLVFDIRDPLEPKLLSRYDTYPGPLGTIKGCWGVYPFLGPGRILASDTQSGLHVISQRTSHLVRLQGGETVVGKDFVVCGSSP